MLPMPHLTIVVQLKIHSRASREQFGAEGSSWVIAELQCLQPHTNTSSGHSGLSHCPSSSPGNSQKSPWTACRMDLWECIHQESPQNKELASSAGFDTEFGGILVCPACSMDRRGKGEKGPVARSAEKGIYYGSDVQLMTD